MYEAAPSASDAHIGACRLYAGGAAEPEGQPVAAGESAPAQPDHQRSPTGLERAQPPARATSTAAAPDSSTCARAIRHPQPHPAAAASRARGPADVARAPLRHSAPDAPAAGSGGRTRRLGRSARPTAPETQAYWSAARSARWSCRSWPAPRLRSRPGPARPPAWRAQSAAAARGTIRAFCTPVRPAPRACRGRPARPASRAPRCARGSPRAAWPAWWRPPAGCGSGGCRS